GKGEGGGKQHAVGQAHGGTLVGYGIRGSLAGGGAVGPPGRATARRAAAVGRQACVAGSERDAPTVDVAGIARVVVTHAQPPGAVDPLAGQVQVGVADHVVGTVAAARVLDPVRRAVGRHQVDLQVAAVAVADVQVHTGRTGRVAAAAGHADRAVDAARAGDRGVGIVAVGLRSAPAAAAGVVVGDQGDAAEAGVRLHPHVPGAGRRAREGAGLDVAAAPRAAVMTAVGGCAAVADVQVRVAEIGRAHV